MTRDDIIRMAMEAGVDYSFGFEMERFAGLVAAHEREACAQIVEANAAVCANNLMLADVLAGNAAAIRERGEPCS